MERNAITDLQVKNVLVLADFSPCSQKALLYAANIARIHGSKLTLLHIVAPRLRMPQDPRRDEAVRSALSEMKKLEDDLLSEGLLRDVPHQSLVRRGQNWKVISRILRLQSTDLIVMGTHGKTGLKKLILGSFAEDVFRQASCPVLTVGPSVPDQAVAGSPRHIVFPNDGSYAFKAAEPYAYQLGRRAGAQLLLLAVVQTSVLANGKSGEERLKHAKKHLHATGLYAAWRQEGVTPKVLAEMGSNVDTILRVADATAADLIILGMSGKDHAPGNFEWDDAYQVVCAAHCPVLTVRDTFPNPYFKQLLQMEPVGGAGNSATARS
jgi:nucleotide-binding universal stress UspA family protein